MSRHRLFVAIPVPEDLAHSITEETPRFQQVHGLRWVPRENLHLTVLFLGLVDWNDLREIKLQCRWVAESHHQFELFPREIGTSPGRNPKPMLWLNFKPCREYEGLVKTAREALLPFVQKPESRQPIPHLTLARSGYRPSDNKRFPRLPVEDFPPFPVESLELWESTPRPGGSHYTCLERWPLVPRGQPLRKRERKGSG